MRLIITLAIVILVSGCQNQMQRENSSAAAIPNPGVACINELPNRSEFSRIANKVSLGTPEQQTLEMFSDMKKPTEEEKTAIAAWVKAKAECNNLSRQWSAQIKMPAQFVTINESTLSSFMILTSELYNGKLTYGEYAKARAELRSNTQQKLAAETQNSQQQQSAAEEQNKNRALMYLMNQQAPTIAPIQMPKHTNCYVVGNQMNCTTQ
ncbi:hypothetical protein [Sulfuricella sp. T08]|uniref:hypothetical protein n=1 Tax=Sulfuricella sp. T08 TaxID=1632857 RepID=UPI0007509CFE|nr:hypothetical protein [Sulfuricella sp. T08]